VGEFIRSGRERFVVGTKYTLNGRPADPKGGGNQRKGLVQSLEASLKRLGIEYLDVVSATTVGFPHDFVNLPMVAE